MHNFTLIQSALGLRDLLDNRHADLIKSKAGKYYEPSLVVVRTAIDALPAALTGGLARADALNVVDGEHDGYGACIWFVTESAIRLPGVSQDIVDAALRVRAAFVPELGELKDSYAVEAHRAAERRPLIKTMKADLQLFPVVGGGTLLEVAVKFLDAGERLNALLSERGDAPKADRTKAGALRGKAVKLLNRLREDLREELAENESLPRDLEHRVFGYIDTLAAMNKPTKGKLTAEPASAQPKPAEPK